MRFKYLYILVLSFSILISAEPIQASETFFTDPLYDWKMRTEVTASLKNESQYAYFYLEDEYWNSLNSFQRLEVNKAIEDLANEFDTKIFSELTQFFGDIWSPGIDNDPKITILFTRLNTEAGGYFNTNNEYSKSKISTSNEREMFYINSLYITSPRAKSFIAHEFQHLITFYQKNILKNIDEEVWLNEARSEYAVTYFGYDEPFLGSNLQSRVQAFLANPSDSLTEWRNQAADYGQVNLFSQYLVSRFGKEIFSEMIKSSAIGIASINDTLAKLGKTATFSQVFTDWTITNLINNCNILPQNVYCYQDPDLNYGNLHIRFEVETSAGESITQIQSAKDWEAIWQEFSPGATISKYVLELDFSTTAARANFKVPYVITKKDGQKIIKTLELKDQRGLAYIEGFGTEVSSVTVIPSNQYKVSGFGAIEASTPFILKASLIESRPQLSYPDGSLLRAKNTSRVYIIRGSYKRWIPNPQVFNMYGHLKWGNIIEVTQEELDFYTESFLVRTSGETAVYEIENGRIKHWLHMRAEDFLNSGRKFEAVFIINQKEKDYYSTKSEIII